MNIPDIAKQLKDNNENIILIYAFNSTGKTRLSVAYKDLTKAANEGNHTGVYYNAFSEDLFLWNNDEENNNAGIKLTITKSNLNQFHGLLKAETIAEKLGAYQPKYLFNLIEHDNPEDGYASITFFKDGEEDKPIKISRGEERIFVWCFFLALFEVDGWANKQEEDAHFFIDDPVSSMDDHNIFVTADSIFGLVEANYIKKRIIVTTHHIGLFSILADRLKKGEKSSRYKNLTKLFVLNYKDQKLKLKSPNNDVFLFHLHLLQTLDAATKEKLYAYHFVLLRQLLENIASFLGKGSISFALAQIGIERANETGDMINSLSHKDAYKLQSNEMSDVEEEMFKDVFQKILVKYNFNF